MATPSRRLRGPAAETSQNKHRKQCYALFPPGGGQAFKQAAFVFSYETFHPPKETDPWIGFIRTDGKPSTI
jgi:hypothetical protein